MYEDITPFGVIAVSVHEDTVAVTVTLNEEHMSRVEKLCEMPGLDIELLPCGVEVAQASFVVGFEGHEIGTAQINTMTGDDAGMYALAINDMWDTHYRKPYKVQEALKAVRKRLMEEVAATV